MTSTRQFRAIFTLLGLLALAPSLCAALSAEEVLVICNGKREGSRDVARHYMHMRGIAEANLLTLHCSDKEEISWDEFRKDILEPVTKAVTANDKLLVLVPVWGVPLKVKALGSETNHQKKNMASVDAELTLLLQPDHEIAGWLENPVLDKDEQLTREHKLMIVCRLDGPSKEIALGLIDRAILAESLGMGGESFLDTRGMKHDPAKNNGYSERDDAMRKVADAWKAADISFTHDDTGPVIDISGRELLHYYGWYDGSPAKWKGGPRFRTGGIGIHLHSFAGATLRDVKRNWVAPLLNWGVTATYGTVYEPYTVGFPYEWIFWDRLVKGYSFGEAGLLSTHILSWQAVFVGDPLYTPYRAAAESKALKDMQATRRRWLTQALVPGEAGADAAPDELADRCREILIGALKVIQEQKDEAVALRQAGELFWLVKGYDLDAALRERLPELEKLAESRWKSIKADLRKDPGLSDLYEQALNELNGFAVHADVVAYGDELAKAQERKAEALLKKAERSAKNEKKLLDAWQEAHEGARYRLCESGKACIALKTKLENEEATAALLKAQANESLTKALEKASADASRGKFDKAIALLSEALATHPPCDSTKACQDKLAEWRKAHEKQQGK